MSESNNIISEKEKLSLNPSVSTFLQIRLALGLSRAQFGALLGIKASSVWNWEKRQVKFALNISQIKQINRLLGQLGLTWEDFPDDAGLPEVHKRTKNKG